MIRDCEGEGLGQEGGSGSEGSSLSEISPKGEKRFSRRRSVSVGTS